jgi:hypothetical protein
MCSVQRLRQILVFGAKNSSGCGFVEKKPQQVVLCAKTSRRPHPLRPPPLVTTFLLCEARDHGGHGSRATMCDANGHGGHNSRAMTESSEKIPLTHHPGAPSVITLLLAYQDSAPATRHYHQRVTADARWCISGRLIPSSGNWGRRSEVGRGVRASRHEVGAGAAGWWRASATGGRQRRVGGRQGERVWPAGSGWEVGQVGTTDGRGSACTWCQAGRAGHWRRCS